MSTLFSPITLGKLALSNRIVISPMCQYSADQGRATDWHLIHLGHLALSGAGLMFIEATAVAPEGRISPDDLGLWSDETEAALARVLQSVRQYSSIPIALQLAHAGRKASTAVPWAGGQHLAATNGGWPTLAPSALPFAAGDTPPLALDEAALQRIRNDFVTAAQRAQRLGLEVNMNNDAGWCGSGGPWITPALAMQKVVWSTTNLEGPRRFEAVLREPDKVAQEIEQRLRRDLARPGDFSRIHAIPQSGADVPDDQDARLVVLGVAHPYSREGDKA